MREDQTIKVIELRNYLLKPDARDKFSDYFARHFVESQNSLGGFVLGTFRIETEIDRFFWIRGFSGLDSRSRYLPEFYGGDIWKEFGHAANEMMLEWHHVYLLKPLGEIFVKNFGYENAVTEINFYFAKNDKLKDLVTHFQNHLSPNMTLWISEMSENDFPKLPVIQDENLLVTVSFYKDQNEFQANLNKSRELDDQIQNLIAKKESLLLSSANNAASQKTL